jgi:lysophospholipase L1-like esterase
MKQLLKLIFIALLPLSVCAQAPDPLRFDKEVETLTANDASVNKKNLILFTGSSTIRMWKDINTYFPEHNVLNRGFGGSQMEDLVRYFDKLILPYTPKQIFIYEGDNDINAKKTTEQVLQKADELVTLIRTKLPKKTKIIFIGAKPSIARKALRPTYEAFNADFKAWAKKNKVGYVDVWTPMLNKDGSLMDDLFIEDGLHMNKKGYDIWGPVLAPYVGK